MWSSSGAKRGRWVYEGSELELNSKNPTATTACFGIIVHGL